MSIPMPDGSIWTGPAPRARLGPQPAEAPPTPLIPMPDGSTYSGPPTRVRNATQDGESPLPPLTAAVAPRGISSSTPAQLHSPVLRDGSTEYPEGSDEPVIIPIAGALPDAAEVTDSGTPLTAEVLPLTSLPASLSTALNRGAQGTAVGAVVIQGSPAWTRGLRRFEVKLHEGTDRPLRRVYLIVH